MRGPQPAAVPIIQPREAVVNSLYELPAATVPPRGGGGRGGTGAEGEEHREVLTTRVTISRCRCPMTGQSGALTLQPQVLTAGWKTFLRQYRAEDVTVDSRDNLSHWHHHSAGAVGEVMWGDGKAIGHGEMGGVIITNGEITLFRSL